MCSRPPRNAASGGPRRGVWGNFETGNVFTWCFNSVPTAAMRLWPSPENFERSTSWLPSTSGQITENIQTINFPTVAKRRRREPADLWGIPQKILHFYGISYQHRKIETSFRNITPVLDFHSCSKNGRRNLSQCAVGARTQRGVHGVRNYPGDVHHLRGTSSIA